MNAMELTVNALALGSLAALTTGLLILKNYLKGYLRSGNR